MDLESGFGATVLVQLHVKIITMRSFDLFGGAFHKVLLFLCKLLDLCAAVDVTNCRKLSRS